MKLLRATQFASVTGVLVVLALGHNFAQTMPSPPVAAAPVTTVLQPSGAILHARAFPSIQLWSDEVLTYVGMFSPDAVFRAPSRFTHTSGYSPGEGILPAALPGEQGQHEEVPPSMLISNERVVENLEPPAIARATGHAPTRLGETRNRFVTYAYGRPSVLHAPQHIATDSKQRLILSDPMGGAVHVLDPTGKTSFRIVCGKGHRLHEPAGVAVDADDNIYVADSARGMLVVFDQNGGFVRYIGNYEGENEYDSPRGIAIDRQAARLYLVDTPRNLVFVLDLTGKVLKRLGKYRDGTGVGKFDNPTDVAVNHGHVFVLDSRGSRVQIVDPQYNMAGSFNLPRGYKPELEEQDGLGSDQQGNVYVTSFSGSLVRVFRQDGDAIASFGQVGRRVGEFAGPAGVWIDSANRLYVADSGNGRVQLFQLQAQR